MDSRNRASKEEQAYRVQAIRDAGIEVHQFSHTHFRLGGPCGPVDFWPSTNKWRNINSVRSGYGYVSAVAEYKMELLRHNRKQHINELPVLVLGSEKSPACIDCTNSFELPDGKLQCRIDPPKCLSMITGIVNTTGNTYKVESRIVCTIPTVDENYSCSRFNREGRK